MQHALNIFAVIVLVTSMKSFSLTYIYYLTSFEILSQKRYFWDVCFSRERRFLTYCQDHFVFLFYYIPGMNCTAPQNNLQNIKHIGNMRTCILSRHTIYNFREAVVYCTHPYNLISNIYSSYVKLIYYFDNLHCNKSLK